MTSYVLVPGAGGSSWYWHRVVTLLQQAGHDATAVDLPGDDPAAGVAEYADLVAAAVGERDDAVLVAQSLGGFTAALVVGRVPLRALVFVNAMIPNPGETAGAWFENTAVRAARATAAEQGGYGADFDPFVYFLHDVDPAVAEAGLPFQRAESDATFASVCEFSGWADTPVRAVAGADDRFFPLEFQRELVRDRLGIEAAVLPGGHLLALSRPEELAAYLLESA
jgi:predicted alpha/beta hydrolase family esterase